MSFDHFEPLLVYHLKLRLPYTFKFFRFFLLFFDALWLLGHLDLRLVTGSPHHRFIHLLVFFLVPQDIVHIAFKLQITCVSNGIVGKAGRFLMSLCFFELSFKSLNRVDVPSFLVYQFVNFTSFSGSFFKPFSSLNCSWFSRFYLRPICF